MSQDAEASSRLETEQVCPVDTDQAERWNMCARAGPLSFAHVPAQIGLELIDSSLYSLSIH